jgi:hypothetical protein
MALEIWENLRAVRLKLKDPSGCVNFNHVLNAAALPVAPARQTGYRADDSGTWYVFNEIAEEWQIVDIKISDETLNELIFSYGVSGAIIAAIPEILAYIYDQMPIVSVSSGSESTQYQSLANAQAFYTKLRDLYKEMKEESAGSSTSKIIRTRGREVGGVRECRDGIW